MKRPSHFNLANAEKTIRGDMRNTTAEALRLAPTDEDRAFVNLQGDLEDCVVAFALWDMRRSNNGSGADSAAEALSHTFGNMLASFVQNNSGGSTAHLADVMGAIWTTAFARLEGRSEENAIISGVVISAEQGGNA